jgi:hypothetical protein
MVETVATYILDKIPFDPDMPWMIKKLRIKEGSAYHSEFAGLLDQARLIAQPKAFYQASLIDQRGEDWLDIDGVRFNSRVLCVNTEKSHRVFPYLATCGQELQVWADGFDDMLLNYWAEVVKEAALFCAIRALFEDMDTRYTPGHTASMSPGSLPDWPIQQQEPLFHLLNRFPDAVGVHLTESMLMIPTKSVSGIRFSTESDFESCQLCSREGCPGRRAVYDPHLYDSQYCRQNGLEQGTN